MLQVIETARKVAKKSYLVRIDKQALSVFCLKLSTDNVKVPTWDTLHHYYDGSEDTVSYFLILDSLNFCFWPPPGKTRWEIEYKSELLSGYYALAASLKQAIESGIPILKAEYLADLSLVELKEILRGRGELMLMEDRLWILNELGRILLEDYHGMPHRMVEYAGNSAINLVLLLAEKFPSFRDVSEYQGKKIFFYKRAQIFAADLFGAFKGKKWGSFVDMDRLTTFADYKLPQVLRHLGILNYSQALAKKVDRKILLEQGSPEEVEIRANTILAVDLIRQELDRMGKCLRSFEIDWLLWNLGQHEDFKKSPFHRIVTIYY